jgi:hypothetical protein
LFYCEKRKKNSYRDTSAGKRKRSVSQGAPERKRGGKGEGHEKGKDQSWTWATTSCHGRGSRRLKASLHLQYMWASGTVENGQGVPLGHSVDGVPGLHMSSSCRSVAAAPLIDRAQREREEVFMYTKTRYQFTYCPADKLAPLENGGLSRLYRFTRYSAK